MQFLLVIFIIYRCFSSSGEASSVDDYLWLMGRAGYKPVIEYCGGTEIGGGFVTGSLLQPQALSAFSTPAMGCNLFILDSSGNPLVSSWNDGIGFFLNSPFVFFFFQKSIYLIFIPMHGFLGVEC
jgi:acyl-coenzyme A synthetase/AMP-(fatty) acid ligase